MTALSLGRIVEPEWLDALPATDPRAKSARRDLARLNAVMLQPRLMSRLLSSLARRGPPRVIIDLGSGDGRFMLCLARILARRWPNVSVLLIDRQSGSSRDIEGRFAQFGWQATMIAADVFDVLDGEQAGADIILSNLFLHHLSSSQLANLFCLVTTRTDHFVACEPRRSRLALTGGQLVGLLGCNTVTRHDAPASVRAGFCGAELSALWPAPGDWTLTERSMGLFSHGFVAARVR